MQVLSLVLKIATIFFFWIRKITLKRCAPSECKRVVLEASTLHPRKYWDWLEIGPLPVGFERIVAWVLHKAFYLETSQRPCEDAS